MNWDHFFLGMARYVSTASKDPSTKCGAVIIDSHRRVVSLGYNGLPMEVEDAQEKLDDRKYKLSVILHAEENAILFADRSRLRDATLYTWPFMPCAKCSSAIIQVGIIRCVAPPIADDKAERWLSNMEIAASQLSEAGVKLDILKNVDYDKLFKSCTV